MRVDSLGDVVSRPRGLDAILGAFSRIEGRTPLTEYILSLNEDYNFFIEGLQGMFKFSFKWR